jgi:hypothetical protein
MGGADTYATLAFHRRKDMLNGAGNVHGACLIHLVDMYVLLKLPVCLFFLMVESRLWVTCVQLLNAPTRRIVTRERGRWISWGITEH